MGRGELALADILADYCRSQDEVITILDRLRAEGWTVYRKKVSVNPRRKVVSVTITPKVARQIRHLHATTDLTQQQIANAVGTNIGRVNEVLHP